MPDYGTQPDRAIPADPGRGAPARRGRPLPRRRHWAAAAAVLSAAVTALLLTACSAAGSTEPVVPGPAIAGPATAPPAVAGGASSGSYVALGDSYTAGPDIPDQTGGPPGCEQSTSSYPYLLAQRLRLNLTDMSCSSATIASLSGPQPTGDGTNPAQLTALSAATRLLTLGIGGNDIGFSSVITRCTELDLIPALIPGAAASGAAPCQAYYSSGGTDQVQQRIQAAAADLAGTLSQIRQRAPHARVWVVGYPDLLPPAGGACAHVMSITQGDATFLDDEELQFNSALRQDAAAAGDGYADTYTPSVGHDACSPESSRWIEPLLPASPAAPMHPNAAGEQGMADAIEHAIQAA